MASNADAPARREIRRIAYRLWEEEGRPDGRDRVHWETAKEIWATRRRLDEGETRPRRARQAPASGPKPA